MHPLYFESTAGSRALTLIERATALRAGNGAARNSGVITDLARRRLEGWRSQAPFPTEASFARRLALTGITENDLLFLLEEPAETSNHFPTPPDWLANLVEAFSHPLPSDVQPSSFPPKEPGHEMAGFLVAAEPLVVRGRERLRAGIASLTRTSTDLPFDPDTVEEILFSHLPRQLLVMVSRTLVLELHVARLQGWLSGDTPEERFQSFVQRLRRPEVTLAYFQEYPVLARQLVIGIDQWVRSSLEFLERLCHDWESIRLAFSPNAPPGALIQVQGGMGDRHRGGSSVLIATFRSGLKVVYKPKALAVDVHVQELLCWLNARRDHPSFRTLTVLDRGSYGWVEFVATQDCGSAAEVRRFYERQGGYLALLYVLGATDFHAENLIAAGEHPVLIDLESLFHPWVGEQDLNQADQVAGRELGDSVLRVGLLPHRLWANPESDGIDLSGLGGDDGQLSPHGLPVWEAVGTDEMHFTRQRKVLPGAQNRPTLRGAKVEVLDYAEAIAQGYAAVYRLLLTHRDELLADAGPLAPFADDEVRLILRPTRTYARLLQESFHPDVLRDALDRDRLFDGLWAAVELRPHLERVIPAEHADLWKGDVPFFTTRPASRDLWTSANEQVIDFLDESGLSLVQRRIRQLGEDDLGKQLWFIRAALGTLAREAERTLPETTQGPSELPPADPERLRAAARAVGNRLAALALHGEQEASWIGLTLTRHRHWTLAPLGMDLYDGLPGVALFLGYLGAITQDERYTDLARAALRTLRRLVERYQTSLTSIGGFDGWGGIIYTLTHLGVLWDDRALLREAENVVALLPPLIERDEHLDVIGGAAGCIGALLSLYRCVPSGTALATAVRCGEWLLARAQPAGPGIGWATRITGARPLTGFAHGAAGIAWALGELGALVEEDRFWDAVRAAVSYERSQFSPKEGNWLDLRTSEVSDPAEGDRPERFMTAWCNGAPGIGLARLRLSQHLDEAGTRAEVDTALRTTVAHGFEGNHSLCHGSLGNLELLLQASAVAEASSLPMPVNRVAGVILEIIEREGWRCGNPLGVESPGLMTGLAGIGYELLRLAEPTRVPSVLILAPPVAHSIGFRHPESGDRPGAEQSLRTTVSA